MTNKKVKDKDSDKKGFDRWDCLIIFLILIYEIFTNILPSTFPPEMTSSIEYGLGYWTAEIIFIFIVWVLYKFLRKILTKFLRRRLTGSAGK